MMKTPLFTRFKNLFLIPPPNGESRHPQAGVICGPNQNVYDGEKKFRKTTVVSEKMGVKGFSLGQFPPERGESCRKEKLCHIWEQEY